MSKALLLWLGLSENDWFFIFPPLIFLMTSRGVQVIDCSFLFFVEHAASFRRFAVYPLLKGRRGILRGQQKRN